MLMTEAPELRGEYRRGTGVTVWTLGHSHHPIELFIARLREHEIERVVDVRSRPYARRAPQFNRPEFEAALLAAGIQYAWLGDKLGQRPEGEGFYDAEGHTLYEELLKEPIRANANVAARSRQRCLATSGM